MIVCGRVSVNVGGVAIQEDRRPLLEGTVESFQGLLEVRPHPL